MVGTQVNYIFYICLRHSESQIFLFSPFIHGYFTAILNKFSVWKMHPITRYIQGQDSKLKFRIFFNPPLTNLLEFNANNLWPADIITHQSVVRDVANVSNLRIQWKCILKFWILLWDKEFEFETLSPNVGQIYT